METDILLSIVIPVYNVQNYIGKCLNSLKTLDGRIEILVVDDGSPDDSCEVIKNYVKDNSNVHYIKKENGGVSSARNLGIALSKGKYITFVDGDDFVDEQYLSKIMEYIQTLDFDLLCFNYCLTYDNHETRLNDLKDEIVNLCDNAGFTWYIRQNMDEKIKQFCLNKVYKTDLLKENKIEFPVGQSVGEDFLFNVEYLQYCKKVVYKSDCLYHYYQRQTSVMRTYNKKYTDHILNYEANLKRIASKSNYTISQNDILYLYLKCWFGVINQETQNPNSEDGLNRVKMFMNQSGLKNIKIHYSDLDSKYKVYKCLVKFHLTIPIYKLLKKRA